MKSVRLNNITVDEYNFIYSNIKHHPCLTFITYLPETNVMVIEGICDDNTLFNLGVEIGLLTVKK